MSSAAALEKLALGTYGSDIRKCECVGREMEDTSHVLRWFRGKQLEILAGGVRENVVNDKCNALPRPVGRLGTHSRIIGPSAAGTAATLQLAELGEMM